MQRLLIAVLASYLLATSAASAAPEDRPIPQDSVRMEQRRRDRLDWYKGTLVGAYEKVGRKNPKWDKEARETLETAARMYALQADPIRNYQYHVLDPAKRAVANGCDDPLILYAFARGNYSYSSSTDNRYRLFYADDVLLASSYPPVKRALVLEEMNAQRLVQRRAPPEEREVAEKRLEEILDLLPLSVAQDQRNVDWDDEWFAMLDTATRSFAKSQGDYQAAFDRVDARLAKIPEIKTLRLQLRGYFLIHYAWEARTDVFAPQVTEEGFRKFHQRLTEARRVLNEAWANSPDNARTANFMLRVEKGIGGNREDLETWFTRAMKAYGDNWEACWSKMDWLDPKWHGSVEQKLAFGRACRETKNYHEGITLLWGESLLWAAAMLPPEHSEKLLSAPGVVQEIKDVYEEYLSHYPIDQPNRSSYGALCFLAGDYVAADRILQALGHHMTAVSFISLAEMNQMRDEAAKRVKAPPKKKAE
jgi:hypothetical protein